MKIVPINADTPLIEATSLAWWLMIYPDDPHKAFECFVKDHLMAVGELANRPDNEIITIRAVWVKALVGGPSFKEMQKGVPTRIKKGVTAGNVLLAALATASLGKPVTFSACIEVMERAHQSGKPLGTFAGQKPQGYRTDILKAWKSMRGVAHLWAAAAAIGTVLQRAGVTNDNSTFFPMLEHAKGMFEWAGKHEVEFEGRRQPLIDPNSAWHIPDFVVSSPIGSLSTTEFPSWLTEAVKGKRSPR